MAQTEDQFENRMKLNETVRGYWEKEPCGTHQAVTAGIPPLTKEWFEAVEDHRYDYEPFIHAVAQFTRHHGKKMLEIGVGAGTDHLQWARAGLDVYGVDLTQAAIDTTAKRLETYGFRSNLQRVDAEILPFPDGTFDIVYSWGVIHHSEDPAAIIAEVRRVLKPGGSFIGMLYGRRSAVMWRFWIKHALLKGRPWRSLKDIVWNHVESIGTKAYTVPELHGLFKDFTRIETIPWVTPYDRWPRWLSRFYPAEWGWFVGLRCRK
jgi:SAM-dependent methyltransferase